jgi:hypothetical protein
VLRSRSNDRTVFAFGPTPALDVSEFGSGPKGPNECLKLAASAGGGPAAGEVDVADERQPSRDSSSATLSRSSTAAVARPMPPRPISTVCQRLPMAAVDVADAQA